MNKNLMIGAAVVIVLLLGLFGFYKASSKSTTVQTGTQTENQTQTVQETSSEQKSLKDLLAGGVAQKCNFTYAGDEKVQTAGTVYVADGKMRGDLTSTVEGKTMTTHMLVLDKQSYIWTDESKTGMKMTFDDSVRPTGTTGTQTQTSVNADQKMDFNCTPGGADAASFSLPAGVEFKDFGALAVPSVSVTGGAGANCATCNYLSGEAKTQCLSALGC